jgi:F0F1-type ATP synthase assembly protein I
METTKKENSPKSGNRKKSGAKEYIKYSGIAFQMMIIILIGVFAGKKLDSIYISLSPLFTISLTFISLAFALYYLFKGLLSK